MTMSVNEEVLDEGDGASHDEFDDTAHQVNLYQIVEPII